MKIFSEIGTAARRYRKIEIQGKRVVERYLEWIEMTGE